MIMKKFLFAVTAMSGLMAGAALAHHSNKALAPEVRFIRVSLKAPP